MSLIPVVSKVYPALVSIARNAIVVGMRDAWARCTKLGNKPEEPDFVASLVIESAPLMFDRFAPLLQKHGIGFSLTSVYCHQTPKVRYKGMGKGSCELGDVLFVHVHQDSNGRQTRNALLCQAKVTSKNRYRVPPADLDQLTLYAQWPEFEYVESPPLTGNRRTVLPQAPHRGGQYLLINELRPKDPASGLNPPSYLIGTCIADRDLVHPNDLAGELVDLLAHRTGRAFDERPTGGTAEGWTQTVWDLLDVSLHKGFTRKNSGRSEASRVSGGPVHLLDGACFAARTSGVASPLVDEVLGASDADQLFARRYRPPEDDQDDPDPDDARSVSLVLYETVERLG